MNLKDKGTRRIEGIEFRVVYSRRRTLGISVLPDSSVIVRVPNRTSDNTINRIVRDKASWIKKHRDNYRNNSGNKIQRIYADGEFHLFRGKESCIRIENSQKPYIRFSENAIEIGLVNTGNQELIKRILYAGYKAEAYRAFPVMLKAAILRYEVHNFRPSKLIIRTMKSRWGSCSGKGIITLNTELIKLSDRYIEYVIAHELCHLKHHNHGTLYYKLLSELFPDWKAVRKEMRNFSLS
jgi:predicted metal-dependent hydrolase